MAELRVHRLLLTGALLTLTACTQRDSLVGPKADVFVRSPSAAELTPPDLAPGQVAYLYEGHPFDRFEGPSYSTDDFVRAVLVLDDPLPPNLSLADITGLAGFHLVITDGHQTLTGVSEALVSTDGAGGIIAPWSFIRNCCLFPNNGVSTVNWEDQRGVFDWGILSAPSGSFPDTPRDWGMNLGMPGIWTKVTSEFSCDDVTEISTVQCEALVALFDGTNGPDWTDRTGWLSSPTPCTWHGVACGDGSVVALSLVDNGLDGIIPSELADLATLRTLRLHRNHLSGPIPAELAALSDLQDLNLQVNALGGRIPSAIGGLPRLRRLNLSFNQLEGAVPKELAALANLEFLDLSVNQLSGPIPPELGTLGKLETLFLSRNQLSDGIPEELGALVSLKQLWLNQNPLGGSIPVELGDIPGLTSLALASAGLTGEIPSSLGQTALEQLLLHHNQLNGSIPTELGNLTAMATLWLQGNDLTGRIPTELGNLTALQGLLLQSNELSGLVPLSVAMVGTAASSCDLRFNPHLYVPDTPGYRALTDPPGAPICGLVLQSAEVVAENIQGQIEDLVTAGTLNGGQGRSLMTKLDRTLAKIEAGQEHVAINLLGAFVAEVTDLLASGELPRDEGESLVLQASVLIEQLED